MLGLFKRSLPPGPAPPPPQPLANLVTNVESTGLLEGNPRAPGPPQPQSYSWEGAAGGVGLWEWTSWERRELTTHWAIGPT